MDKLNTLDLAVYIAPRMPHHQAAVASLRKVLDRSVHVVVVVLGLDRSTDLQRPFTAEQRIDLLAVCLTEADLMKITFVTLLDELTAEAQLASVVAAVTALRPQLTGPVDLLAPDQPDLPALWGASPPNELINGYREADMRFLQKVYFAPDAPHDRINSWRELMCEAAAQLLGQWQHGESFKALEHEYLAIVQYRRKYSQPSYRTADCMVTCAGKVLLIERGGQFGQGLLALPGGFVDEGEPVQAAAFRELLEETGLNVKDYPGAQVQRSFTVDDPHRSPRAILKTDVCHVDLGCDEPPVVVGNDDARQAFWVLFSDLPAMESRFFEDHGPIIRYLARQHGR